MASRQDAMDGRAALLKNEEASGPPQDVADVAGLRKMGVPADRSRDVAIP